MSGIKRLKLATEEKLTVGGREFPTLTFLAVKSYYAYCLHVATGKVYRHVLLSVDTGLPLRRRQTANALIGKQFCRKILISALQNVK